MKVFFLGLFLSTSVLIPNTHGSQTFSSEQIAVEEQKPSNIALQVGIVREESVDYFGFMFTWENKKRFGYLRHPSILLEMRKSWKHALKSVSSKKGKVKKEWLQYATNYAFNTIYESYFRPHCWKMLGALVGQVKIDPKAMQICMEGENIESQPCHKMNLVTRDAYQKIMKQRQIQKALRQKDLLHRGIKKLVHPKKGTLATQALTSLSLNHLSKAPEEQVGPGSLRKVLPMLPLKQRYKQENKKENVFSATVLQPVVQSIS